MAFDQIFNLVEGILWIVVAIVMVSQIRRNRTRRDLILIGAIAFFLFGLSDFIEMHTRAWYEPVPLLILNVACVSTFMGLFWIHRKRKIKEARAGERRAKVERF